MRDYERASEWCDRIAEFAKRYGSRYMLAFCRAEYGGVHLWRGSWRAAEEVLEASVEDFSRSRPAMVGGPLAALAELRRRQGRSEEALSLLRQAGASPSSQLCQAQLALDRGQTLRALELGERVLRQLPEHRRLDRAPALELLVCARVARGELDEAHAASESLREIDRLVGTAPLRASADLAEGLVAAASGEHDAARALFEDALDGFERAGGRYDAARARIELATSLYALGRGDEASSDAAAGEAMLRDLGAVPEAERARRLLSASRRDGSSALSSVTPREREVLALLAAGLTKRRVRNRQCRHPGRRSGRRVVASDLTPEHFKAGREEARNLGIELEWVEADAEDLPFVDGEFDVVTSSLGAIFAPDHRRVADELLRVCRPGGTIGMLNFTPEGLAGDFFGTLGPYMPPPPPGALPPLLWGSEDHVRDLFGDRVASLEMTRDLYVERAASPHDYVELIAQTFGPAVTIRSALTDEPLRAAAFDRDFLEFADRANTGDPAGPAEYRYEYLLVIARQRQT